MAINLDFAKPETILLWTWRNKFWTFIESHVTQTIKFVVAHSWHCFKNKFPLIVVSQFKCKFVALLSPIMFIYQPSVCTSGKETLQTDFFNHVLRKGACQNLKTIQFKT